MILSLRLRFRTMAVAAALGCAVPISNRLRSPFSVNGRGSIDVRTGNMFSHQAQSAWITLASFVGVRLHGRIWRRSKKRFAFRVFNLKSSEFDHLFEEGPTEAIYAGTPVESLSQHEQGKLCKEWTRHKLQELNPASEIEDPELGLCCNGRGRTASNAAYDFKLGDRRIQIKSSRLRWVPCNHCWKVRFYSIKMHSAVFDDLYLVVLSPSGLSLIKHDLATGIGRDGRRTETHGYRITVYGGRYEAGSERDLDTILLKLCKEGSCKLIARDSFAHPTLRDLLATFKASRGPSQALWDGIPMSNMSKEKRGLQIQAMGLDIDRSTQTATLV